MSAPERPEAPADSQPEARGEGQPGRLRRWFEQLPPGLMLAAATLLALAPWPIGGPQPHLVEKLGMLADGQLTRPIDIFDLFMHGAPLLLALARAGWEVRLRLGKKQQ